MNTSRPARGHFPDSHLLCREQSPSTLTGKVNQLEVILRQLQTDLRKVRLPMSLSLMGPTPGNHKTQSEGIRGPELPCLAPRDGATLPGTQGMEPRCLAPAANTGRGSRAKLCLRVARRRALWGPRGPRQRRQVWGRQAWAGQLFRCSEMPVTPTGARGSSQLEGLVPEVAAPPPRPPRDPRDCAPTQQHTHVRPRQTHRALAAPALC